MHLEVSIEWTADHFDLGLTRNRPVFTHDSIYAIASMLSPVRLFVRLSDGWIIQQESHAVAGKPRDAAVNSDRYRVRWHFAGAISVSRMQSVSGCTVYA